MTTRAWRSLLLVASTLAGSACSSSPDENTPGAGGAWSAGGAVTGGASAGGSAGASGGLSGLGGSAMGGAVPSFGGASGGSGGTGGSSTGSGGQLNGGTTSGGNGSGSGGSGGHAGGAGAAAWGGGGASLGGTSSGGTSAATGGLAGAGGASGGGATAYNPCPMTAACNVLPLGDSITEGCCTAPMGGYRIELFRQALANRKNVTFVGSLTNGPDKVENVSFPKRHEGHGGWTISQIDGVVPSPALNTVPHIVLLMIGTNDLNGNMDVNNAPMRLGTLIDGITSAAPAALVVVAGIIPSRSDSLNQRVQTYNSAMRTLVSTRAAAGKHVVFIDQYATFTQNANYRNALMIDNLHPNDAGYVALGKAFYSAISAYLPAMP